MSLWMQMRSSFDNHIHIVPVDEAGRVVNGHWLKYDCQCKPKMNEEDPEMLVHFDPNRGGFVS